MVLVQLTGQRGNDYDEDKIENSSSQDACRSTPEDVLTLICGHRPVPSDTGRGWATSAP